MSLDGAVEALFPFVHPLLVCIRHTFTRLFSCIYTCTALPASAPLASSLVFHPLVASFLRRKDHVQVSKDVECP